MSDSHERLSRLRDRYSNLVSDRFYAMVASLDFRRTQKKWLRASGRMRPFRSIDDWIERETAWKEEDPGSFFQLESDVCSISRVFALAPWHVLWTLFVRGHRPGTELFEMFPMDVRHPRACLLVSDHNAGLIEELNHQVVGCNFSVELRQSVRLELDQYWPAAPVVSLCLPIEFPPELAQLECRRVLRTVRQILRNTGLAIAQRMRKDNRNEVIQSLVFEPIHSHLNDSLAPACQANGLMLRFEGDGESHQTRSTLLYGSYLEVRFPPTILADRLSMAVRGLIENSRVALRTAGLNLGDRLRPSLLAKQSGELKVDGLSLPKRGIGDLTDNILGEFPSESGKLTHEGLQMVRKVKSSRYKIKRRFERKQLLTNESNNGWIFA